MSNFLSSWRLSVILGLTSGLVQASGKVAGTLRHHTQKDLPKCTMRRYTLETGVIILWREIWRSLPCKRTRRSITRRDGSVSPYAGEGRYDPWRARSIQHRVS